MERYDIIPFLNGYAVRRTNTYGQKHYLRFNRSGRYYWTHDLTYAKEFTRKTAEKHLQAFPGATDLEWYSRPVYDKIFTVVREHLVRYSRLSDVASNVFDTLRSEGHSVSFLDYVSGKYITLHIDGHDYRIIADTGWGRYDVRQVN